MAKSIAMSCPTCLSVNDPVDMLPVTMPHSTPPQTAPMYLCRLCVLAIMKAAIGSELIDPVEVFHDAYHGDSITIITDPASPPTEATSAVVPESEPGAEPPTLDRLESEVPAGGDATERKDSEGGMSVWNRAIQAAVNNTEIADWIKTQTPETLNRATFPKALKRILAHRDR